MNDERFLKDWLRDSTDSNADPNAAADKVVARLHETHQRRHWLPWPRARRPRGDAATDRRTRMMFSPITALTVGTLALAASGALYVAQAPADEAALAPAANEIDPAPVFFTGKLSEPPMCDVDVPDPTTSVLSGVIQQRDQVYACFQWETTEPRLNGESVVVWNTDRWTGNSDRLGGRIQSGRELITTESGAWEGTLTHLQVEDGLTLESGWYVGSGAHDGLVAYVVLQDNGDELWGYISGDPPPMPEEVPDLLSDAA